MRGRQVPREVLKKQIESFQCPYYYEGWDSIKIKWTGYEYIGDILLKNNIPHDNPHHSLNILEHMYKARELFLRNELDKDILGDVILLHDIGKYFTKTIDENGIAKYYNHQNVGAYFLLCDRTLYENCSKDNLLYAACLIQWHMEFFLREEKGLKRLREMIGENMWRDLNLLHRYDLLAH